LAAENSTTTPVMSLGDRAPGPDANIYPDVRAEVGCPGNSAIIVGMSKVIMGVGGA
jgi:hypothetical protein